MVKLHVEVKLNTEVKDVNEIEADEVVNCNLVLWLVDSINFLVLKEAQKLVIICSRKRSWTECHYCWWRTDWM